MEPIINVLAFISVALISYGVGGMHGYNKGRKDEFDESTSIEYWTKLYESEKRK